MKTRHPVKAACLAMALVSVAWSQNAPVPAAYQDLYTSLQSQLDSFNSTVNSQWNGAKSPVIFSAELLSANANNGLQLLTPQARTTYLLELSRMQALGVQAVVIPIGFPILYQPFFTFNGDPDDYQNFINYYKQLVVDVHAGGMKLIVETAVLFPGFFSQNSGFNLAGFYATQTTADQITAGRAQNAINILAQVQPDFLNLGSEPDTQATNLGGGPFEVFDTPDGYASSISTILSAISAAGLRGKTPIGAGIGTWLADGSSFIQALVALPLDYIDLHIYPVNLGFMGLAATYADMAIEAGKNVAISEAWLLKERDSELGSSNNAASPNIFARDPWSFWAPLDQEFLTSLVAFSHWKNLQYFSAFWSRYFWAYLDYNQYQSYAAAQVMTVANTQAQNALQAGSTTSTFTAYKNAIAPAESLASLVSAASFSPSSQAADSIVSIFGSGLASGTITATNLVTLPTSLGDTAVPVTDAAGNTQNAGLYFVSAGQINAVLPAGMKTGRATINVVRNGNTVATASTTISAVAPAFFTVNQNGKGAPAALVLTFGANHQQISSDDVFQCGTTPGSCTPKPIKLGTASEVTILELYGTGIRGRSSLSNVQVTIGSTKLAHPSVLAVAYAGPQSQYAGFDQLNVELPATLAGTGTVNLTVTADGQTSNVVTLDIQ